MRIHQTLSHRLLGSRSNELLGEAVNESLRSPAYERIIPRGISPVVWATGYVERQQSFCSGSTADSSTRIGP